MTLKLYNCEVPGCTWKGFLRSKIKMGDFAGLKACPYHYSCSLEIKPKTAIPKITSKKAAEKKSKSEKRNTYFEYHIPRCHFSEESRTPISNPGRCNICHLFGKEMHPSLEANLDNYVYLTLDEHTMLDQLLFRHDFQGIEKHFKNSYKIIWQRMFLLLPLLQERTRFSIAISEYLGVDLK